MKIRKKTPVISKEIRYKVLAKERNIKLGKILASAPEDTKEIIFSMLKGFDESVSDMVI